MKHISALLCLTFLSISHVQAEALRIPISQQGAVQISMPTHGDKQTQVLQQFGEPRMRHQSVGQPPISRWDYPGFSVYFEHSTVVNSVQNHQRRSTSAP